MSPDTPPTVTDRYQHIDGVDTYALTMPDADISEILDRSWVNSMFGPRPRCVTEKTKTARRQKNKNAKRERRKQRKRR